ncbi:MAG: PHP domain-containing protein, partial [Bacilli bacterium]|nr:PHP domain-containing protein [Bacilli bacterium]
EIIGLYLNERIEPKLSASDTIKEIRRQKGLVYIPHPYDGKRHKTVIDEDVLRKIKNDVDFIECHNGRNIKKEYSDVQDRMADELNITKIIGSDVHTFYEVGRNYCLVNPFTKETLVKEIKTATFHKKNCLKFAHFHTKIVRLIKLIKGGNFSELSRIINKKLKRSR